MKETFFEPYTHDALLYFTGKDLKPLDDKGEPKKMSPGMKQAAVNSVAEMIAKIESEITRDWYTNEVYTQFKDEIGKKKYLTDEIKRLTAVTTEQKEQVEEETNFGWKLPKGVKESDVYRDGFYQVIDGAKTGLYMRSGKSSFVSVSNFTIIPLFHKVDEEDNCRIIEINDGIDAATVVEMPSSALISRDSFRKFLFDHGPYFFNGDQYHLEKINLALLRKFPKAYELKNLGMQPEGFFAFYNAAFNGTLKKYDKAGLIEHEGKNFYSPAVSMAYDHFRKGKDRFENDRYLQYCEAPINFEQWMDLVARAYPDHKYLIIGGALLALHRDLHFKIDQNCPHIYFHGATESGKTKAAQTISNLFFKNLPGFNLSTGTDFAFAERLGRYRNTPAVLNEFDMDMIKDDRYNSIKMAYDGEGRDRGKMGTKGKTEMQEVASLLVLVGQYLMTHDDNSVVNRSMLGKFKLIKNRPTAQKEAFDELKKHEKDGLGSIICELLAHRKRMEKEYAAKYHEIKKMMVLAFKEMETDARERPLQNYATIPTLVSLFQDHFKFPFTLDDAWEWAIEEVKNITEMVSEGDILNDFWNTIEALVSKGFIRQNEHFKREYTNHVKISKKVGGQNITETISFGQEEKAVMYINMPVCHKEYHDYMKGKAMSKQNLENYLKDKPYYIGYRHATRFDMKVRSVDGGEKKTTRTTSAFIIDIEKADLGRLFTEIKYEGKDPE